MAASKGFLFVVLPQLRSSMNNKAPIDREASGESDPPLLPQIDFLQVDGRSVGRAAVMITNTDRSGDLQSTEQHQSLSRGSNGAGVYQDDIYRESGELGKEGRKEGRGGGVCELRSDPKGVRSATMMLRAS